MADVLLTVSGMIPPDIETKIAQGERPCADYIELARTFGADLLDYGRARQCTGWLGQCLEKIGGANLMLAWACFQLRNHYRVIFTDGEQIGIPLALLCKAGRRKGFRHLMIAHVLSVGKKILFMDRFGLQDQIDTFFVYSTWQKQFIEKRWGVPPARVVFTPFMVDSCFFSPQRMQAHSVGARRRMICAVGLEFRDYHTLLQAVHGLDVEVIIAAASPWSKRADTTEQIQMPVNVVVRKFTQFELRQLYADSLFVVMPLYNVNFQAGVTAILEAMAMSKAVICSRTPGQTDVVVEGETGLYVQPRDPQALRHAIEYLLDRPIVADQMGHVGRRSVERELNLACYTERLNYYVQNPMLDTKRFAL